MPRRSARQKQTEETSCDSERAPTQKQKRRTESKLYEKISKFSGQVDKDEDLAYMPPSASKNSKKTAQKCGRKRRNNDLDDFVIDDAPKKAKLSNPIDYEEKPKSKLPSFVQAMLREPPKLLGQREMPEGEKNCLAGLTFVITGILEFFERDDVTSLIQRYGGRITTAVSRKTTYLIVGREPGLSKMSKAKDLKIPILGEEQFYALISDTRQDIKSSEPKKTKVETRVNILQENELMKGERELWVDKYKPKDISEIVGQHGAKSPANKLIKWLTDWKKNRKSNTKNFFAGKEDGSLYKACLISGQPGVGKSTTASLVCKQLGYNILEMNASDTRNKSCLDKMLSTSLQGFWIEKLHKKLVVIIDEIDGMSGNEDRGGIQEIVALIKTTKIPIICICNDRMHQKIRSLSNHCFDLRFHKPRIEQIKAFIVKITTQEQLEIEPQAIDQLIVAAQNDIRAIINNLQMTASTKQVYCYDDTKSDLKTSTKDFKENLFDVAHKIFTKTNPLKFDIKQKSDLFFVDYSLVPLFVQENYLMTSNAYQE
ncbi:Replication factor C subunit 1 [Thelohanellus kitauei]|uniref:Replication factor C subunit 1 n=1 Tax=Thelohanellus kitauei TaxID=669202 RepID=A0A0C2JVM6_THEKT|nr:Replication factor C subunit 1 [Thelohanellus kitauei]